MRTYVRFFLFIILVARPLRNLPKNFISAVSAKNRKRLYIKEYFNNNKN